MSDLNRPDADDRAVEDQVFAVPTSFHDVVVSTPPQPLSLVDVDSADRDVLASAIYGTGEGEEWLPTLDGSPCSAAYEYASRVVAAGVPAQFREQGHQVVFENGFEAGVAAAVAGYAAAIEEIHQRAQQHDRAWCEHRDMYEAGKMEALYDAVKELRAVPTKVLAELTVPRNQPGA